MKSRGLFVGIIASVCTLALVAVIIVAAMVGTNLSHSHQVDRANEAASRFTVAQTRYQATVKATLDQISSRDPKAGLRTLETDVPKPPKLIKLSGYGPKHSRTYKRAMTGQTTPNFDAIRSALKNVQVAEAWSKVADKMLVSVDSYGVNGPQRNGAKTRDKVLNPMTKKFSTYKATTVPSGSESLDKQIRSEVTKVLKNVKRGADRLDSGRNAPGFRYPFPRLRLLVLGEVAKVRSAVSAAVEAAKDPRSSLGDGSI